MTQRDPFQRYREAMDQLGFRPSRTLGQNFLLDPSLHRWIAEVAEPAPGDLVLEIGAGLGFLTRELAGRCRRVVAAEIDSRLRRIAAADLAELGNVELLELDALGGPGRSLHPQLVEAVAREGAGGAFLVVANLPYAVSGPLLAELCLLGRPPDRAIVLVQKELAERIAGSTAAADYGALSVLIQSLYQVRRLRDVPPQVFRPRPRVASSVLRLDRRAASEALAAGADRRRRFAAFVRRLFQQRRKTLRATLPSAAAAVDRPVPHLTDDFLQRRAESLEPPLLWDLWLQVERGGAGGSGPQS